LKVSLELPADFRLYSTVFSHGYVQIAPFAWIDEGLERVDRMKPDGRAHRVRMEQKGRTLELEVYGARSIPERYVLRVRRMLQLDRSLSGFHRAIREDAHLDWIRKKKYGRILRTGDLFEDVVKAICGTNTQWSQAVAMANRIASLGPRATKIGQHAFPSPKEVARAGARWLRAHARTGYRADYIVALARAVDSGTLDVEAIERDAPAMSGDELRKRLLDIKGIGPATVRYLAGFFGKFDAVSVDSAVISYATIAHFNGVRPSPRHVETHFARYGDYRGLVCWFEVWQHYCVQHGLRM
jgi:3-methyladenine DNA glycosylase/8-oxoguanine DNA glycosylase